MPANRSADGANMFESGCIAVSCNDTQDINSALCDTTSTSAGDVREQAMPLTCSAGSTNASESGYVVVSSDGPKNINSALAFFGTQNIKCMLVFFAVVLVAFICLVFKCTSIASALIRILTSARSTNLDESTPQCLVDTTLDLKVTRREGRGHGIKDAHIHGTAGISPRCARA